MKRMRESLLAFLLVLVFAIFLPAGEPKSKPADGPSSAARPAAAPVVPGSVVVQLLDGGTLKLNLLDDRLAMETPYGRLTIPTADIVEIRFGLRIDPETGARIAAAVESLGADDFDRREAASAELLKLRERAHPALVKLAASEDLEVAKRAQRVLEELLARLTREELDIPSHDEVTTVHSRIAGWIAHGALKVRTFQFGEQSLRLSDARGLKAEAVVEPEPTDAVPDPGNLAAFQAQVGKTLAFKVTGAAPGAGGSVWGTDMYTLDSNLSLASVHAGVLKPGQQGVVRVTILGPQGRFDGSQRHGVSTATFAHYPGAYRFVTAAPRKVPRLERPAGVAAEPR